MGESKWEVAGGGEKPLFLLVLSSSHIDEEAMAAIRAKHSRAETMHRALIRRYGERNNPQDKEGK